jgi:hypothetical protein
MIQDHMLIVFMGQSERYRSDVMDCWASGVEEGVVWLREWRSHEEARSQVSTLRHIGYWRLELRVISVTSSEAVT